MKKNIQLWQVMLFTFCGSLFLSCDNLEDDVIPESTDLISLNTYEKNMYIKPGGELMINVAAKLQSRSNAIVQIGESPKNGSLQFVNGELLKYAASENFTTGSDFFTIKVMRDSQVLDQDTISIIIPTDTTDYPCWNGAMADRFFVDRDSLQGPYKMDVLSNDYLCDSTTFSLAVVQQPQHGSAKTAKNTIHYKPKFSDNKILITKDTFLYELCQMVEGNKHCTLAKVEINFFNKPDSCLLNAVDDYKLIIADSADSDTTYLAVIDILANDQICGYSTELSISHPAKNGGAYIQNNNLYYSYPKDFTGNDTLKYQICDSTAFCSEAIVSLDIE